MDNNEPLPVGRYRGVLVWFDAEGNRVRHGRVERAVLRSRGLSLELTTGGQPYTVTLRPQENAVFQGSWTRGAGAKQATGAAECVLAPCGEFIGRPGRGNLKLEGCWFEAGSWDWVAKLQPLAPAGTSGTDE